MKRDFVAENQHRIAPIKVGREYDRTRFLNYRFQNELPAHQINGNDPKFAYGPSVIQNDYQPDQDNYYPDSENEENVEPNHLYGGGGVNFRPGKNPYGLKRIHGPPNDPYWKDMW